MAANEVLDKQNVDLTYPQSSKALRRIRNLVAFTYALLSLWFLDVRLLHLKCFKPLFALGSLRVPFNHPLLLHARMRLEVSKGSDSFLDKINYLGCFGAILSRGSGARGQVLPVQRSD